MMRALITVLAVLSLGLAACGEKPQAASTRKADAHPFEGAAGGHSAPGWKAGDATSWEQQMRTRAQAQNEYSRVSSP